MSHQETDRPFLLRPDNFTPLTRTPWAGTRILSRYKPGLGPAPAPVGESWEISVEPDFPSRCEETGELLAAVLARSPTKLLGREATLGRTGTALLVKLLDAADDLSVQIHPADGDPQLGPDESGKPEAWYILERDAGAVIYLGLRDGVERSDVIRTIDTGASLAPLLFPVPIEPGDFFVLHAGTAHAIGRGACLVEPQSVEPGRRGVTYRYWDWNRRYDASGALDPSGRPRPLHLDRALGVTRWQAPREAALLDVARVRLGPAPKAAAQLEPLCGPGAPLGSDDLCVARLAGTGEVALPDASVLRGLTVVGGHIELAGARYSVPVHAGWSAVLPACLHDVTARLTNAHALLCSVADSSLDGARPVGKIAARP